MISMNDYKFINTLYESNRTRINRVQHISTKKNFIFKILNKEFPSSYEFDSFKREFEILDKIKNCDGIPNVYDFSKCNHLHTIIMNDINGSSLRHLMKSNAFSIKEMISIAIDIASIIGDIHAAHIIHKDINPGNIVLDLKNKKMNIIDFGISTKLSIETPSLQSPNVLEGSFSYISPEQTGRMNRSLDYRTDYYSFGVTLFELLTQTIPFQSSDPMELIHCHIARQANAPHEINPDIPPMLSKVVIKLLSKNAEDRYQSSSGMIADLMKCKEQYLQHESISDFSLAEKDIPERFQIPQKLYGRDYELNTLLTAFDCITLGTSEMVLIAGYSGIGKTALVKEIYKPITRQRGYIISGKFDQFQRDIPYKAIVEAFSDLASQLLTEKEEVLNHWIDKMISALGPNGQVIIEMIPDMEAVIGKQPDVIELAPAEAQNRFNHVFQNFVHVFTDIDHPLVMFLDDLQWADMASLKLIQLLMKNKKQSLLIIGAYRDNEVNDAHPLMHVIGEIKQTDASLHEISLAPLSVDNVSQLIYDTLFCSKEESTSLTQLIHQKTGGNPFFINEFLKTLYVEGLIIFNQAVHKTNTRKWGWQWDIKQIQEMEITDNVVDLMSSKIKKLDKDTQDILNMAACIGNSFDLNTLAVVTENYENNCLNSLQDALSEGLIISKNARHYIASENHYESNKQFKFSHDRIQQAAYSLTNDSDRKKRHYSIGQLLLKKLNTSEFEEEIFDVVNQLNFGIDSIKNQYEKNELARLNLIAGQKAKASTAYEPAFKYLKTGIRLLDEKSWESQYDLALSLYIETTQVSYLIGKYNDIEKYNELVLNNAKTVLDKVKFYEVIILAYSVQNNFKKSIKTALKALKLIGISFPVKPNKYHIILELIKIKLILKRKKIEELSAMDNLKDQSKLTAIRIMDTVSVASYSYGLELYILMTLERVKICAKHGNSIFSPGIFATYGLIIVSVLEDFDTGYQFGQLSLKLLDKYHSRKNYSQTYSLYLGFIYHWKEHIKETFQKFEKCFYFGVECGEVEWAGVAINGKIMYLFFSGINLFELLKTYKGYTESLTRLNHYGTLLRHNIYIQTIVNIIDIDSNRINLNGQFCNEDNILKKLNKNNENNETTISHLLVFKLILCCIFNEATKGKRIAEMALKYIDFLKGQVGVALVYFCISLINLTLLTIEQKTKQRKVILKQVKKHLKKLKKYAHHAPMNHLHKYYLVKAELYRVKGKDLKAIEYYDKAIKHAKKNEYTHEEAMAAERAALFWLEKKNTNIAAMYMNRAYQTFKQWGANNKLRDLEEKYSNLLHHNQNNSSLNDQLDLTCTVTETTTMSNHNVLDLSTVFKASQAISNEMKLINLIQKLLTIVIENAGAEKGILVLNQDDTYVVTSQVYITQEAGKEKMMQIDDYIALDECKDLPEAIILYAARSFKHVVLNDASNEGMFTNDPFVKQHSLKSILCTPIIYHGELTGVIYLENSQTIGAFTPERVEMLKMITSQAAISIENAKLYTNLEEYAETVKAAEQKYRGIFENAIEGIFQSTPDGRFLDANPAMAMILGFKSPKEMIEQDTNVAAQCYANPEDRNRFIEMLLNEGKVIGMEGEFLRKNNTKGWAAISARAVCDNQGNTKYYEGTLTDITERKEKEHAERAREIAEASKEKIMDSIRYAQIIQQSLLPDKKLFKKIMPDSFIFYQPKDIVGGDIFFIDDSQDYFIIAVIDCTGHGVPGAFMTMIACSSLRRIVSDEKCYDPSQILKKLNFSVKTTLQQNTDNAHSDDGMDVCMCAINKRKKELTFSGAKLPLIYVENNEIHLIKGDRQSIGYKESKRSKMNYDFTNHTIPIKDNMSFYLASDGYQDQLGGKNISCFGNKKLKNLLKEVSMLPFDKQKEKLTHVFHEYRGENDIQDDLTVVGFRF